MNSEIPEDLGMHVLDTDVRWFVEHMVTQISGGEMVNLEHGHGEDETCPLDGMRTLMLTFTTAKVSEDKIDDLGGEKYTLIFNPGEVQTLLQTAASFIMPGLFDFLGEEA